MNKEKMTFLDAMGKIDDHYILEASQSWIPENSSKKNRKKKWKRYALLAAAALAISGSALAAGRARLAEFFQFEFLSKESQELVVDQIIAEVSEPEHIPAAYTEENTMDIWNSRPKLPDPSALLTIEEAQFDGITLYIAGTRTENGQNYDLNSDRIYINDTEYGPVNTAAAYEDPSLYSFTVNLSQLDLKGAFKVTLPLSVYDKDGVRYQNQELTFWMDADRASVSAADTETVYEHDRFTLTIKELLFSTNVLQITAEYQMKAPYDSEKECPYLTLLSEDGEELHFLKQSSKKSEDGSIRIEASYAGFETRPEKVILGTKMVPAGGYISQYPIVYRDEISLNSIDNGDSFPN